MEFLTIKHLSSLLRLLRGMRISHSEEEKEVYGYSADGERFWQLPDSVSSYEDAYHYVRQKFPRLLVFHVGVYKPVTAAQFMGAGWAPAKVGEHVDKPGPVTSEQWLEDVSPEAAAQLRQYVSLVVTAWADAHGLQPNFSEVVGTCVYRVRRQWQR